MRRSLYLLPAIAFFLLAGILGWRLLVPESSNAPETAHLPVPAFSLPVLKDSSPLTEKTLAGQITLLHFFASWCATCVLEKDEWLRLGKVAGVQSYAVAWNDTPEKVEAWLEKHGNAFDRVAIDMNGKFGVAMGLTGVPETFLIGRDGNIIWHTRQPLSDAILHVTLLPQLTRLTGGK